MTRRLLALFAPGLLILVLIIPAVLHLHEIMTIDPPSTPARTQPRGPQWRYMQEVKVLMDIPQDAYCYAKKADDCFAGSGPDILYIQSGDSLVSLVPFIAEGNEPKR